MAYQVEFTTSAAALYRKLPPDLQDRLRPKISALAEDPRPPGNKKLSGGDNDYRIRVGKNRIQYHVDDKNQKVTITKVGDRNQFYRKQ